jgi:hypothetical protein
VGVGVSSVEAASMTDTQEENSEVLFPEFVAVDVI